MPLGQQSVVFVPRGFIIAQPRNDRNNNFRGRPKRQIPWRGPKNGLQDHSTDFQDSILAAWDVVVEESSMQPKYSYYIHPTTGSLRKQFEKTIDERIKS